MEEVKSRPPFTRVTFSDSKGAKEADEHHRVTGHILKTSGKKIITFKGFDFIIKYKCSKCDFVSESFARYQRL